MINSAYATVQFWDGRAATLEDQAVGPMENPIEMGTASTRWWLIQRDPRTTKDRFQKVFGTDVTADGMAKAIAAFERHGPERQFAVRQVPGWRPGGAQRVAGARHEAASTTCPQTCHAPPLFSNYKFYNAGIGMDKRRRIPGARRCTNDDSDLGKFRVPGLREVANTAPYFHDGSCATLAEAVALMASWRRTTSEHLRDAQGDRRKTLSDQDKADLGEFLKALVANTRSSSRRRCRSVGRLCSSTRAGDASQVRPRCAHGHDEGEIHERSEDLAGRRDGVCVSIGPSVRGEGKLEYPKTNRWTRRTTIMGRRSPIPIGGWKTTCATSADVEEWVAAQNKVTFGFLERSRNANRSQTVTELWDYEKYGAPFKLGGRYFYLHNTGPAESVRAVHHAVAQG